MCVSLSNCNEYAKTEFKYPVFRENKPAMIMKTDGAYNLLVFLSNNIGIAFRLVPLLIDCLLARNQDKFQALPFFQLCTIENAKHLPKQ